MNQIIQGNCIEELKKLEENSVDAIITDPPYGIGFMGKEWDNFNPIQIDETMKKDNRPHTKISSQRRSNTAGTYDLSLNANQKFQVWFKEVAKECLRVLKSGGYLLSFGGTRTYHRLVCGIEDAGFEIRDTIIWLYGSGFPKSLNIGKQIDKLQGNEREVVGKSEAGYMVDIAKTRKEQGYRPNLTKSTKEFNLTKGSSEWEGWGTALKPACEPIVVARKPLSEKNVALNVLKHGTGGINIDACRVGFQNKADEDESKGKNQHSKYPKSIMRNPAKHGIYHVDKRPPKDYIAQGRFPANIILDEDAGKMLDEQSGDLSQGHWSKTKTKGFGDFGGGSSEYFGVGEKDKSKHGASRFFYCAKSSKSERNFGLENTNIKEKPIPINEPHNSKSLQERYSMTSKNNHPTVKPIALMEYLIKLVTKENAIVLDPFLGSGTTVIACLKLNRQFIGIEKEEEYIKIAKARLKPFLEQTKL